MSDIAVANSTYSSGTTDSASTLVNNVTSIDAQQWNGVATACVGIETILGTGTTLKGSTADLVARLAVNITAAGALVAFPAGTLMLFVQTSAPTGWTKSTTHNNKALRVVSGTAGSGGSVAFTTAFAAGTLTFTSGGHAITTAEMPAHTHSQNASGFGVTMVASMTGSLGTSTTGSTGGDGVHTHGITGPSLAVNYVDCIIASKD
jgi:hypothetical protein